MHARPNGRKGYDTSITHGSLNGQLPQVLEPAVTISADWEKSSHTKSCATADWSGIGFIW